MRSLSALLILLLGGCAITRDSYPIRTATEEMLISEAADDASGRIILTIPEGRRCFLDSSNVEGLDSRYVISSIRESLLRQGLSLVERRDDADTIIEVRTGAISIDSQGRAIIIPGLNIDKLLGSPAGIGGVTSYNQWTKKTDTGVVNIRAFAYDRASGKLISIANVALGRSKRSRLNNQQLLLPRKAD